MRLHDAGIGIVLLGHVATGDEDHQRGIRLAGQHVEVALQFDALEGHLKALNRIRRVLDHLFVVGDAAAV